MTRKTDQTEDFVGGRQNNTFLNKIVYHQSLPDSGDHSAGRSATYGRAASSKATSRSAASNTLGFCGTPHSVLSRQRIGGSRRDISGVASTDCNDGCSTDGITRLQHEVDRFDDIDRSAPMRLPIDLLVEDDDVLSERRQS